MRGDPYAMTARFNSECAGRKADASGRKCGAPIKKGDRIWYFPNGRTAYAMNGKCGCGEQAQRDFEAACMDEGF